MPCLRRAPFRNATVVLISIGNHYWRWVEREDFLWRHQPYFGFILVKQLRAAIEKVAVLFHVLLNPLTVLKPLSLHFLVNPFQKVQT
jgi:hypothetical protein